MSEKLVKELWEEWEKIVLGVRNIRVGANQALRHVEVPEDVVAKAKKFIKHAPNQYIKDKQQSTSLRYQVLDGLRGGGIYELLVKDAKKIELERASDKIAEWIEAIKHLRRYALNLMLAPKRPEFQSMKLYSSFYVYQVAKNLGGAEVILLAMGYSLPDRSSSSEETQELKYKKEVDLHHMALVVTDLVVLTCDLELLKGLAKLLLRENPGGALLLTDILHARNYVYQTYPDTHDGAIFKAQERLNQRQIHIQRNSSSQNIRHRELEQKGNGSIYSSGGGGVKNQFPRRGSEPLLDKKRVDPPPGRAEGSSPITYPTDRKKYASENDLLGDGNRHPPVSYEQRIHQVSAQSLVSSPIEDSLYFSPSSAPPPDPNDLPAPFLENEGAFSMGQAQYQPPPFSDSFGESLNIIGSTFDYDDNSLIIGYPSLTHEEQSLGSNGIGYNSPNCFENKGCDRSNTYANVERRQEGQLMLPLRQDQEKAKSENNLQEDYQYNSGYKHPIQAHTKKFKTSPLSSIEEQHERHSSLKEKTSSEVFESNFDDDGFAVITRVQRNRAEHISTNSRSQYEQENKEKPAKDESVIAGSDSINNGSQSHWICDYCTNINTTKEKNCEVCGVDKQQQR